MDSMLHAWNYSCNVICRKVLDSLLNAVQAKEFDSVHSAEGKQNVGPV